MPEKMPQPDSLDAPKESLKSKLQKATALGVVAFTALAGEACSPDKGKDGGQVGGRDKPIEIQKGFMLPNPALLAEYRKNIHTGNFPSKGQEKRTIARALEIIILKGMSVNKGSKIEVESRGTVPVQIKIDGQFVPVSPDDYMQEELDLIRLVQGISASMGNAPDRTDKGSLGSEEKISPLVEKIFKKTEKRPTVGPERKIYTAPNFEDFYDGDNKPEK